MHESILKIICDGYDMKAPFSSTAKEIEEMFERFVEWLVFEENDFYPQSDIHNEGKVTYWNIETNKYYNLKELFSYWLTNVKSKSILTTKDLTDDDNARAQRK